MQTEAEDPNTATTGGKGGSVHGTVKMSHLVLQIVTATGCRLLLNVARRFAYPFAPALSRGLQVPLTAITSIIAVMQLTGILGVLGGPVADKWGYRRMMLAGLGMMSLGLLAVSVAPVYGVVMAGLFLAGFAKNIFDPAIYGYTGQRVPFKYRGRVTGILEIAWAASALVGIPAIGFLIESQGWRAPFLYLGGLGLLGLIMLAWLIPSGAEPASGSSQGAWLPAFRQLVKERQALGLLGFVFFASIGNDQLFVVYGAWMEKTFSIGIAAIGMGTGAIGAAEFVGEMLTATLGDRIGLKRSMLIGTCLACGAYLMLPLLDGSLFAALSGLFVIFLAFEFSMVSGISLSTEALPAYRGTMMAAFFGASGIGRVAGALIGGPIWLAGGIQAIGVVSALSCIVALTCLLWGLKSTQPGNSH